MKATELLKLSIFVLLSACATQMRTTYAPQGERGGYSDAQVNSNLRVARFAGNAYTHPSDAELFSVFRAVEVCSNQPLAFPRLYGTFNRSTQQTVQRSSSYNYQAPTYFSGNANSNTQYNAFGSNTQTNLYGQATGGQVYGGQTSWNETLNYPVFDTLYSCVTKTFRANLGLEQLTADKAEEFVKDRLGALVVKEVLAESPNKGIVKVGDIITKVNGERVEGLPQFSAQIDNAKNPSAPIFTLVREGKTITVHGKAIDSSDEFRRVANEVSGRACAAAELKKQAFCANRFPASSP